MNEAPTSARLVNICDDLLSTTNQLKAALQAAGQPWPSPHASQLINRLLDIRNELSPPTSKPPTNSHHV